jgi:bacitracin transport system permease protein
MPNHFAVTERHYAESFTKALDADGIKHRDTTIEVIQIKADLSQVLETKSELYIGQDVNRMAVISDTAAGIDLTADQTFFTGANDEMQKFLQFKTNSQAGLITLNTTIPLTYTGIEERSFISRVSL